jgi:hypothetical protein
LKNISKKKFLSTWEKLLGNITDNTEQKSLAQLLFEFYKNNKYLFHPKFESRFKLVINIIKNESKKKESEVDLNVDKKKMNQIPLLVT